MTINDKNYRVLVMLQRLDRPKHWVFNCPNCKREIRELDTDIQSMSDTFHSRNYGQGITCGTGWCRIVYYFKLSD